MPSHTSSDNPSKRASLFRNGRNQAVRIPREFELPGKDVIIRQEATHLVIEPVPTKRSLQAVLAELKPLDVTFPDVDEGLPPLQDVTL